MPVKVGAVAPVGVYHPDFTGVGGMLFWGTAVIIRSKFSASAFWKDCAEHSATMVQCVRAPECATALLR